MERIEGQIIDQSVITNDVTKTLDKDKLTLSLQEWFSVA